MRRIKAIFLTLTITTMLSISAFTTQASSLEVQEIDLDSLTQLQVIYVGEEFTPQGRAEIYVFAIPGDGNYYEIPDFCNEYDKGTRLTVVGTWDPSYAGLTVMFRDVVNGGAVETPNTTCNDPQTFTLWNSSDWALFVRAKDQGLVGTIRVEAS